MKKKKKKKHLKRRIILSLVSIGIIVGGSVPVLNHFNSKKAYADSLNQAQKDVVDSQIQNINKEISKLNLNNIQDTKYKNFATTAIDNIKIGSIYSAKTYISQIKDKPLQKNLNQFMSWYDYNSKENNLGQLSHKSDVSKTIFSDKKYPGISDSISFGYMPYYWLTSLTELTEKKVYYYNPNVLTEKTLYTFYNDIMKANSNNPSPVNYILRDIYNPNFGIWINTNCDQFNTGNINPYGYMLLNKNLSYCYFHSNGDVSAYNSLTNKKSDFILK